MKPIVRVSRDVMARKPAHGQPCNGCGACCIAIKCELGLHVFGGPKLGRCPALVRTDAHAHVCGLTTRLIDDADLRDAARVLIGAGTGCDARFNGEPPDQKFYRKLEQWDHDNADRVRAARRMWNMQQEDVR